VIRRPGTTASGSPAAWLGLVWVYSGILWLIAMWLGWKGGRGELALLAFCRATATVGIGVAVCGTERWGWAVAVSLSAIYAVFGAGLAALVGTALAQRPPGSLSWQPVLWGLTSAQCIRMLQAAGAVTLAGLITAIPLWRARAHFDVPAGKRYGTLVSFGLVPTLLVLLVDGLLLIGWARG
jgi:hypothetical protein